MVRRRTNSNAEKNTPFQEVCSTAFAILCDVAVVITAPIPSLTLGIKVGMNGAKAGSTIGAALGLPGKAIGGLIGAAGGVALGVAAGAVIGISTAVRATVLAIENIAYLPFSPLMGMIKNKTAFQDTRTGKLVDGLRLMC